MRCVFRVEIAKRRRFQPIEKFLLKTQNAAAFKLANVTDTKNLGENETIFKGKKIKAKFFQNLRTVLI